MSEPIATHEIFEREDFKTLLLRPDDVLVLKVRGRISKANEDSITEYLKRITGHERILILDDAAELALVRPEPEKVNRPWWRFW